MVFRRVRLGFAAAVEAPVSVVVSGAVWGAASAVVFGAVLAAVVGLTGGAVKAVSRKAGMSEPNPTTFGPPSSRSRRGSCLGSGRRGS